MANALYLVDAGVLITANNQYYGLDQVPEYWEWLLHQATSGRCKMPIEFFEEIKDGRKDADKDQLLRWTKTEEVKAALVLSEDADPELVAKVVYEGYGADLTDIEIEALGRDPFLVAYGLAAPADRCVVTTEKSRPSAKGKNRKIPDVCGTFGIRCVSQFEFARELGFSTSWKP